MIVVSNKKIKNYQCYMLSGYKKYICIEKRHINEYKNFIYVVGYMIKNNIDNAFFKTKDNRVALISLDLKKPKSPVDISYLNLPSDETIENEEDLRLFIEVSKGKYYTPIYKPLSQIGKEIKFKIESNTPKIIVVLFILLAVLGGYLYHQKMEEKKHLELIKKTHKRLHKGKRQKIPMVEKAGMKEYISHKFIGKLAGILSDLREYQKISSLTLSYKSVTGKRTRKIKKIDGSVEKIDGSIKYTILSVYPVPGSIKKGEYYVVEKEDIIKGENKTIQGIIDKVTCGEKLLSYGADLISLDKMKFTLKTDDYRKFIDALNYIYNCNFYFENLKMTANNYSMSVILR